MREASFAVLMLLLLGWALFSAVLARANINGPLVFLAVGYLLGNPDWGILTVNVDAPSLHVLAELTLALLLFSDASRVNVSKLRRDFGFPLRLLVVGLPLSVLLGSLLASWLLHDLSWALALFVGATLAPTDAALSAQVINDTRIPMRLRRALNVESGLNDGIVTPVVVLALALAATQLGVQQHSEESGGHALVALAVGIIIGLAIGWGSAVLISLASRRHWMIAGGRRLATLGAALGSFGLAVAWDGNGFIAAFVAGLAFGAAFDDEPVEQADELPELLGEVLALSVWFLFGAALVPVAVHSFDPRVLVYALSSLTLVRLLPVALALLGAGMDRPTVLFVGWFGPRGLASVVFALLAVEELGETPLVGTAVGAISLTVLASVLLHGFSAGPLGTRYARRQVVDPEPNAAPPRARRVG